MSDHCDKHHKFILDCQECRNAALQRQSELAAPAGSTEARPLSEIINEIKRIHNRGDVDGVIGYAIQWRTSKGNTVQMHWGQLKQKLP